MTGQESDHFGYRATILRGVWERIQSFGVPRFYSHAWAAVCLFLGLIMLTYWGFAYVPIPLFLWLVGHFTLVLLTQWNHAGMIWFWRK